MEKVLIGAGLGAAGSAVTGRNPLKGALLGAAGGGLTGGASNYFNTGSLLGASPVGAQVAQNAMIGAPQAMGNFATLPGGTIANMDYYQNILGTPVFTGGQGVFSNAYDMATNALPDIVKSNATPTNLMLANSLLQNLDGQNQMGASPISVAVRPGSAPQQYSFNTGTAIRRA
jgi:hypothetical protein